MMAYFIKFQNFNTQDCFVGSETLQINLIRIWEKSSAIMEIKRK